MRILGVPILSPAAATERIVSDLQAMARMARAAPAQLDRVLELGEEIARTGQAVLEVAQRLERRAEVFMVLAERLDARLQWSAGGRSLGDATHPRASGGVLIELIDRASLRDSIP